MAQSLTADERNRRIIEYLAGLHQGRLKEFQLTRANRVANFRKQLMQLINEMIEIRAEEIAAGMLMEYAAPRPKKPIPNVAEGRLPLPPKRSVPVWIKKSANIGA